VATPEPSARLALIGSGPVLVRAIEAFRAAQGAAITVVVDVSGASEGSRLARSLGIQILTNPMEIFRTSADLVLELNGDARQYERLLAVKPSGVEVMSVRGARLLMEAYAQGAAARSQAAAAPEPHDPVRFVVSANQPKLYEYLPQSLAGIPGIEVLADRRAADRRQRPRSQATDRRAADRRRHPGIDEDLRVRGFAITRPAASAG
jgi:hypothetical protein